MNVPHWIDKPTGRYGQWQSWCSECGKRSGIGGTESNRHKPFCPNCGIRMGERNMNFTKEQINELEALVKQVAEWLNKNADPHTTVTIETDRYDVTQDVIGSPLKAEII